MDFGFSIVLKIVRKSVVSGRKIEYYREICEGCESKNIEIAIMRAYAYARGERF